MAVALFTKPELVCYKCNICSLTTIIYLITLLITWLAPFFIIYGSGGLWEDTKLLDPVQANLNFKYQLMVYAITEESGKIATWSTMADYNNLYSSFLRMPSVKASQWDDNNDGKYDRLDFQLDFPLQNTEEVYHIKAILFFDYILESEKFSMESLAYLDIKPDFLVSQVELTGNLKLAQTEALPHFLKNDLFNNSILNISSHSNTAFDFANILKDYNERNVRTEMEVVSQNTLMRRKEDPFVLKASISYPMQSHIIVQTSSFSMFKWAYIQHIYVALGIFMILYKVNIYIFSNQIVRTTVTRTVDTT